MYHLVRIPGKSAKLLYSLKGNCFVPPNKRRLFGSKWENKHTPVSDVKKVHCLWQMIKKKIAVRSLFRVLPDVLVSSPLCFSFDVLWKLYLQHLENRTISKLVAAVSITQYSQLHFCLTFPFILQFKDLSLISFVFKYVHLRRILKRSCRKRTLLQSG